MRTAVAITEKLAEINFLYPTKSIPCRFTVAENIAFMEHLTEINWSQIYKVAKLAQIYDFVSTLPDGFNTRIGQSGSLCWWTNSTSCNCTCFIPILP